MMKKSVKHLTLGVLVTLGLLVIVWPALTSILGVQLDRSANAQQPCTELAGPRQMTAPALINFDTLPNATVIGNAYLNSFGVSFENSRITQATIYGNEPLEAHSPPNVAINGADITKDSSGVPMTIFFDTPKTQAGLYIGNGETAQVGALLTAYDDAGNFLCQARRLPVPEPHTEFIGLSDPDGRIASLSLSYGDSPLPESIDDLYFSPRRGLPSTRTPMPTWTPVPSPTPTQGPAPTPTPVVPVFAYQSIQPLTFSAIFQPDLSIHGIEITQGIQCFDTSKGLATCPDNTLPVVNKKDTAARIYLKSGGIFSSINNVPVRLHIRANGVWYSGDASGKATASLNRANSDSANIYFNVNFSNDVVVDFYAEVDPNNTIAESDETNNRYPSVGYLTLTFRTRATQKIIGQRLHYHPSGYAGTQYAGGWAVNGGGADWLEQVLPMRNNGINYSVKSGYLDWTQTLGGNADGQHALIQTLNAYWILENAFAWLFTGDFTGANHVYGWAPSPGYSGGHADMPVYPHAGGLGVVGIGSDAAGTNTDNPGSGALIFGHELVHDYDVFHTNTADSCGSNDGNSDFPYGSSSIQEFGFNPITGKIYDPATTHDLMSYCPSGGSKQGWISPFTWSKMFNDLTTVVRSMAARAEVPPQVFFATDATQSLVVNATIYNPDLKPSVPGALGELYLIGGGVGYFLPQGDYAVELRDSANATLYSQPFTVNFESEYDAHSEQPQAPADAPPFPPDPTSKVDVSFILPWMDTATSVVLVHLGTVLDQRAVSSNPPQVFITNPSVPEVWLPGSTHTLNWQGLDLDDDALRYSVFYSNDNGANWVLLQSELDGTSFDVNVNDLAGGSDVRFRVLATDGLNTGLDETDEAITIPNQAPQVTILNPAPGGIYPPGSLVVLTGMATDFEDGTLPDESLVWSSDQQGGLGVGPSVPLNTLAAGQHIITLTTADSLGIFSSASVTITIAYSLHLPLMVR